MEAVDPDPGHLDENLALDLLGGRVLPPRAAALDAHLERCPECRQFVIHLARVSALRPTTPGHDAGGDAPLDVGSHIDRYVIDRQLGAGAMGVVYAAHDPELDRRVAIKVLRPGTLTPAARERMAREARTLAKLSHPNVVAVHDVGPHGDGMFIVMELVEGVTAKRWLAERRTWREIVGVMVRAGRGLAAAHAAGLVHRDFKPDNVMIADDGRVLVADFGLARPAEVDRGDDAGEGGEGAGPDVAAADGADEDLTATGAVVGTPAYMAPEQHAGDAGPGADQFAFCVTVHEALYGRRPFAGRTSVELYAAILAGTIEAPSSPTIRAPSRLARIVARGLRADPAERYPAMEPLLAALAHDPGRHVRWIGLGAVGLVAAVGVTWAVTRSADAPGVCGAGGERVAAVWNARARTALGDAFARASPGQGATAAVRAGAGLDRYAVAWTAGYRDACEATHVRGDQSGELLDKRMACLDGRLAELGSLVALFADADAALVERGVGAIAALPAVRDCAVADALDDTPLPQDPDTRARVTATRALLAQARVLHNAGKYKLEEPLTRDVAARAAALGYPPLAAAAGFQLGRLEDALGHAPAALTAMSAARLAAETAGNDRLKAEISISIANIAALAASAAEAQRMELEAEATVTRLGTPPELAWLLVDGKAKRRYGAGDYAAALPEFERALGLAQKLFPAESYEIANLLNNIGSCQMSLGKLDDAIATHHKALAMRIAVLGPDHPAVADSLLNLANCQLVRGQTADALPLYDQAIGVMKRGLGENHVRLGMPEHNLGLLYLMQGDAELAALHAQRAVDVFTAGLGPDDAQTARSRSRLAVALAELGKLDEAERHAAAALATLEAKLGPDHQDTAMARMVMGDVRVRAEKFADAATYFQSALVVLAGTPNEEYALHELARCELELGRGASAVEHLEKAIPGAEAIKGADNPLMIPYLIDLARAQLAVGRPDRALAPLRRSLELEAANGDGTTAEVRGQLRYEYARALWARPADRERALAMADEALALLAPVEPAPRELAELRAWLAAHRK